MNALLALFLLLLSSCSKSNVTIQGVVFCMPLTLQVKTDLKESELKMHIFSVFNEIDEQVNHFNPKSMLSKFNKASAYKRFTITPLVFELLQQAKELYLSTHALFDPTFGNFDKLFFNEKTLYKTDDKLQLDLNALSKGKAIDLIYNKLKGLGINDFIINWAGDIRTSKTNSIHKIKIRGCQHILEVKNKAIATSAADEQARGNLTHFIDASTAKPIDLKDIRYKSITVVSETCAFSDALATSAFLFTNTKDLYSWIDFIKKKNRCQFYLLKNDKTLVVK